MRIARRILETFWIGTVTFILVTTLVAFLLSWNGLQTVNATLALIIGGVATILTCRKDFLEDRSHDTIPDGHWFWRSAVAICFCLFSFRAFLWLIFLKGDSIAVLSRNNLGDLPLHIQYIRFFSQGGPLWPINPVHAHSTIGYPFGVDYFNAVLDICGVSLWNALIGMGLICSLVTGVALYRWGRAFGVAGFLFNGGAASLAFFTTGKWEDYQQAVDWKCIPLALFVTQRGFLYALPAGLLLLTHWRRMHTRENRPARSLPFWLEWLIYGTMPLFHIHTFLFLSLVIAWLAVFGKHRARLWLLVLAAFLPASGLMYLLTDGFHAGSSLGWLPGWLQGMHFSWTYWLRNFGVMPVLVLVLGYVLVQQRRSENTGVSSDTSVALNFVWPSILMLGATVFFKFSPWAWDNTKLMMWSYLVILPFLWKWLVEKTTFAVRVLACALLFTSGFISLWGGLGPDYKGFEIADQPVSLSVGEAVKDIPIIETFAAAPDYAHPLVFNGRRLALGYHGHMIGHGIAWQNENVAMDLLMSGSPGWEKAAAYLGVTYIYWGTSEGKAWPTSTKPWVTTAELVASQSWGEIYKLPAFPQTP